MDKFKWNDEVEATVNYARRKAFYVCPHPNGISHIVIVDGKLKVVRNVRQSRPDFKRWQPVLVTDGNCWEYWELRFFGHWERERVACFKCIGDTTTCTWARYKKLPGYDYNYTPEEPENV